MGKRFHVNVSVSVWGSIQAKKYASIVPYKNIKLCHTTDNKTCLFIATLCSFLLSFLEYIKNMFTVIYI